MNTFGLILLPLGCILVAGMAIVLAWKLLQMGPGDSSANSASVREELTIFFNKYKPYFLSPLFQAILLYLISFIPLMLIPAMGAFAMLFLFPIIIAFTCFSGISPIINLYQPRWWLNTVLFIASWFLLFYGLIGTLTWRAGEDASEVAIGFGPAMLVAFFVLAVTAVLKLIEFILRRVQNRS